MMLTRIILGGVVVTKITNETHKKCKTQYKRNMVIAQMHQNRIRQYS